MPTAELLKPATLHAYGRVWVRGEKEPIDNDLAAILEDNPRFRVRGFGTKDDDKAEAGPARPKGQALLAAIREAVDGLDVEDESSFTASGAPNVHAVSYALGYPVSRAELDKAMQTPAETPATDDDLVSGKKSGRVKIKRVPRPQDPGLAKLKNKQDAASGKEPEEEVEVT